MRFPAPISRQRAFSKHTPKLLIFACYCKRQHSYVLSLIFLHLQLHSYQLHHSSGEWVIGFLLLIYSWTSLTDIIVYSRACSISHISLLIVNRAWMWYIAVVYSTVQYFSLEAESWDLKSLSRLWWVVCFLIDWQKIIMACSNIQDAIK